ncbi:pitrilysin family protein [uncultured Flavobacterium sp.]|uniref:M16 family metallopeptidase n=1 Tax=uncultured Flavobacterium sp. TaxID=165435 RepID=UPI0030EC3631
MKKLLYIVTSLFFMTTMTAQDRPMPKSGPAPSINIKKPETFKLKNGLKVLVVENSKLPRVSYTLTIDNTPYVEGNKKGVDDMLSAMIGNETEKTSKEAFNEEIDFLGANINFNSSGARGSGLSKYSERILELMAEGSLTPKFTQEEFDKEKSKMIENLKSDEKNVTANARRVENILVYGKNHPRGEYVSEETLNNVSLADVKLNYNINFVPENAYLVIIGDVKLKDIKKQVEKAFKGWKKATAPQLSFTEPTDLQYTQVNFVDMSNAVQSEIAVINTSNLKMTDKEYYAALLANQILGGGGEGRLFLNLREKHGWTYGSYSSIGSGKYTSKFRAGASVRNSVTDSAIVEILNEVKRMRNDLVSAEDLKNAKAKYVGNFVMQIEKPETVAFYALNKETQNLPDDFYENYIKNINAVTAEDIKAAANKYFLADNLRIVVVGKAADVLPGLEKSGIPVMYFDRFGNKVDKPVIKKDIPKGVTAKTVLENYINAIGGEKALKAVKSTVIISKASVQGQELQLTAKTSSDKKMSSEMSMQGMTIMKMVVTDKGAYAVQQGQRKEFDGDKLKEMQEVAFTFPELLLVNNKDVVLKGIESVNGADAYALTLGNKTTMYDVKSGLKIAESVEQEQGGQTMTQVTNFTDYKEVKGIKFPYNIVMNVGMELEFVTQEVKINEGVTAKDFE